MSRPLRLTFVRSATDVGELPETRGEVAVIGRSNVGKSSLINALANAPGLARVSKTPGRTQLINLFATEADTTLADLPGYGYAAVSKSMRAAWSDMTERYLLARDPLAMIIVLVDAEIGPTKLDLTAIDWLRGNALAHTIVATKADKVKQSARVRRARDLATACLLHPDDVVWVSAAKGEGIDRLRGLIRLWLE